LGGVLRRLLPFVGIAVVAAVVGGASAVGPAQMPGASAQAWAVRVSVGGGTATATAPPNNGAVYTGGFAYPGDGSVITTGATSASATTRLGNTNALGRASADVASVSIFGGEITADAVAARAQAGAQPGGAAGDFNGTAVANLQALGQSVSSGRINLGDWGYAIVDAQGTDTSAPAGAHGYKGYVTALIVHVNVDHGGLPAGSEIQLGYAEAAAQTPPPPAQPKPKPEPLPSPPSVNPMSGDRPQTRPKPTDDGNKAKARSPVIAAPTVHPPLTAGRYVFPVYGPSSYVDTFGAPRADVAYHHGNDIFGQLGQPLLAVADGQLFSVGWNKIGGNRLWLRDSQGNQFYYAHLSAFSTLAVDGAHVQAGDVIGFLGNSGDAITTPVHLHFEVHPVSLLYLGYDGAVDPTPYLDAWKRLRDLPFPIAAGWAPSIPGSIPAPQPGAFLLSMADISSADGLDPKSLERALAPPRTQVNGLPPSAVPTTVPPKGDIGKA
jgi:murein DD-endopeptidase MepM/ murein hydrolase activator NlpD